MINDVVVMLIFKLFECVYIYIYKYISIDKISITCVIIEHFYPSLMTSTTHLNSDSRQLTATRYPPMERRYVWP